MTSCLHAGHINETTTESDLLDFFNRFAVIKNIRIRKKNSNGIQYYWLVDRRIAFIDFYSAEDAYRVKSIVNRSSLWKGTLQFARTVKEW